MIKKYQDLPGYGQLFDNPMDQHQRSMQKLLDDISKVDPKKACRLCEVMMQDKQGLATLSLLDSRKLINPETLEQMALENYARPSSYWVISLFEWSRNILVLAPITITWLELSRASFKYSLLINTQPELAQQPFLYLWENNFYSAHDGLTFSQLAMLDFYLLLAVVILTIFVHSWKDFFLVGAEKKALKLRSDLEKYFSDLEHKLFEKRNERNADGNIGPNALEIFHRQSDRLLRLIQQSLSDTQLMVKQKEKELINIGLASDQFGESVRELSNHAQDIRSLNKQIQNQLNNLENILTQTDENKVYSLKLVDQVTSLALSTKEIAVNIELSLREMTGTRDNMQFFVQSINTTLIRLSELTARLVSSDDSVREVLVKYNEIIEKTTSLNNDNMSSARATKDSIEQTRLLVESIQKTIRNINQPQTGSPNMLLSFLTVGIFIIAVALIADLALTIFTVLP